MKPQQHLRSFVRNPSGNRLSLIITVFAFGLIGSYLLYRTFAAGPFESVQAEAGSQSGAVALTADTAAANGQYAVFGAKLGIYNDTAATTSGTWTPVTNDPNKYQNNDQYSQTVNSEATFAFTGTQVTVYGAKASHHGIAGITIDNGTEDPADAYSATRDDGAVLYQSAGLTAGSHTVKIRVTGTKNAASSGTVVALDKFTVGNDTNTAPPPTVPPTPPNPPPINGNRVGVTLTHNSVDFLNAGVWAGMTNELKTDKWLMNTHIHGFGVYSPTQDNYASLDARINKIRAAGGEPVITLCCATGAQTGTGNDYDYEDPLPQNYDAYAQLSADIANRYKDVRYFQVWNEMKGFYRADLNRWNYEAYTTLYNKIYTKVKQVRPDAQVGGPYPPMESWTSANFSHPSSLRGTWGVMDQRALDSLTYWLANKVGGEFITMDGGGCPTLSKNPNVYSCAGMNETQRHDYFKDTAAWVRQRTNLPIWWAEFYPAILQSSGETYRTNTTIDAVTKFQQGGGNVALMWMEECSGANFAFANLWGCDGAFYPVYHALKNGYN